MNNQEQYIEELTTMRGYMKYFHNVIADYSDTKSPSKKAWEATERAHKRYFYKYRYTSFESFKSALSRYNKKKRNNK